MFTYTLLAAVLAASYNRASAYLSQIEVSIKLQNGEKKKTLSSFEEMTQSWTGQDYIQLIET